MSFEWCIDMILRSYPEILLLITIFFFLHLIFLAHRPINWPIIGMLPSLLAHLYHPHDYITQVLSASRLSFMFQGPWFTGMNMLITCDPDNVNYVFNTHDKFYPKGDDLMEMFSTLGDCMLTNEGEKWRWHRKTLHRLLSNQKFQEYELKTSSTKIEGCLMPILERCAQENKTVDLQDLFLRLIMDTACAMFLGVDPSYLNYEFPAVPFARALETLEEVIIYQHAFPKIIVKFLKTLNLGYFRKLDIANKIIDQFVSQKIEEQEIRGIDAPADFLAPRDIIDKNTSAEFAEIEKSLKSNAKNILLASTHTNVASLTWFFWLLSKHPDVENKIINELKTIWPGKNLVFERESFRKLVYLHGAIYECLRLYPPVPLQQKSPSRADILPSGHRVWPGMFIIFHTYSMGRMESIWGKDCTEFKPERWINEKGELRNEPTHKFFSFNCGPRICLGKEMTLNKMKMVIVSMLCNFHVEVVEGQVAEPKLGIILHMKNGLIARLRRRHEIW